MTGFPFIPGAACVHAQAPSSLGNWYPPSVIDAVVSTVGPLKAKRYAPSRSWSAGADDRRADIGHIVYVAHSARRRIPPRRWKAEPRRLHQEISATYARASRSFRSSCVSCEPRYCNLDILDDTLPRFRPVCWGGAKEDDVRDPSRPSAGRGGRCVVRDGR